MNEQNIDTIANYLNDKLSVEEKADFEKELSTNNELRDETDNLRLLKRVSERNRILENAKLIHNQKIKSFKKPSGKVISLAKVASFAAAASVIFIIYLGNTDVNYIEVSTVERGESTTKTTLSNFENGITFLKQNKNLEAIKEFDYIIDNQDIEKYYHDAATWYEVVALANNNEDLKAEKLLDSIEADKDFKYKISFWDEVRVKMKLLF